MRLQTQASAASGARGCSAHILSRPLLLVTLFLFGGVSGIAALPNSSDLSVLGPPLAASTASNPGNTVPSTVLPTSAAASNPPLSSHPSPSNLTASALSQTPSPSLQSPRPTSSAPPKSSKTNTIREPLLHILYLICEAHQSASMWDRFPGFCGPPHGYQPVPSNTTAVNLVGQFPLNLTYHGDILPKDLQISRREGLEAVWSVFCGLNRMQAFYNQYLSNCPPAAEEN